MKLIYLIIMGALFLGCQSSSGDSEGDGNGNAKEQSARSDPNGNSKGNPSAIQEELESLTTIGSKISFHRQIIKTDLDLRKEQTDALQNLGYNSTEYKEATDIVEKVDRDNLAKAIGFIEKFGISENQSVGRMQSEAMWLVMSHNTDIEIYQKLFPAFKEAWEIAYLEPTAFASFMQDYHQFKNGSRLELKNPYRTSDEVKALLKALE